MDYPKMRPLDVFPVEMDGRQLICLRDPQGLNEGVLLLPIPLFRLVCLFDGRHSVRDIQTEYMRRFGELLFTEKIDEIIEELDSHLFLEGGRFDELYRGLVEEFRRAKVRRAIHAGGCYDTDPQRLHAQIEGYFTAPGGPGLPEKGSGTPPVKGAIAPHIDLRSGGSCFAWAYKEIAQGPPPDLFVVLGTAHQPMKNLFALSRKDFETPLGKIKTDREFLTGLTKRCAFDFFEDELHHRSEHTIEFQLLFLQYLYGGLADVRIVPVLCGSFHEMMSDGARPERVPQFEELVRALRESLAASGKRACLIASADLAHVGLRYGDPFSPSPDFLERVTREDLEMLGCAERLDRTAFLESIRQDGDRRRICGFPPIYTLLSVIDATRGRLLKYDRCWMDAEDQSAVTFASMSFYD